MDNIYFDYAATTPTDPEVIRAMEPFFYGYFGNASSPHSIGREARKALEESRETVAKFIGADSNEIIFNSGATEGNNHSIFGITRSLKSKGNHIIVSPIEHHSVLEPIEQLQHSGYKVTYLQVDENGHINPEDVQKAIGKNTILIAIQHANNEIGTIQAISKIGKIANAHNVPLLVDAVQSVGHILVNVNDIGADLLTMSGHKFYGPNGIGALYIRKGTQVASFLLGGDQESGRRASTQNISGAVGLAKALEICEKLLPEEMRGQAQLRNRLLQEVPNLIDGVKINGHPKERLPNNVHFSFEKLEGESLLMSLDMAHMAASMGSACTSGAMEPSHTLRALGLDDELAYGSLRITMGRWTTEEHVDYLLKELPQMVTSLRT